MVLFRRLLGDVLRSARMQRGMTLRELSADARVSLGYISEIERGQKEASSELLASLCQAMGMEVDSTGLTSISCRAPDNTIVEVGTTGRLERLYG